MPNEAQQVSILSYVDFTGGMNSAVPPTSLQDNEYQLIRNMEFNFNKLCTRGGLSTPLAVFSNNILAVHWDEGTGEYIVVLSDKSVHHITIDGVVTEVGEVVGNKKPNFCEFDGRVFIASGGKLQFFDYTTKKLTTISTSYICDSVFERFGRLVITQQGDDNVYYSAVGDPYTSKKSQTTITDQNGYKTVVSETYDDSSDIGTTDETTESTSTKTTTTDVGLSINYYSGNKLDDFVGTSNADGTASNKTQSYTYKKVETYKNDKKTSTVYYLNNKKSTLADIKAYTFSAIKYGSIPATTGYTQVTDSKDMMYGSVYRDEGKTDGGKTRTYYFDKTYNIGKTNLNVLFKRVVTYNSSNKQTAGYINVPYMKLELLEIPTSAINQEVELSKSDKVSTNISGGTKDTHHRTLARLSIADNTARAYLVYQDVEYTDVKTVTSSTSNTTGTLKDNKGYKVGSKYSGVANKTVTASVKNSDGTTTKYSTVVNSSSKVTKITVDVIQITKSTSTNQNKVTTTNKTVTVSNVDNGTNTITTTTSVTKKQVDTNTAIVTVFSLTLSNNTTETTAAESTTTTTTVTSVSGWDDDSNDDSTSKWLEVGYKDNGDILKVLPISGDIAVFKNNGRVYSISNEYPNWTVSQIAEHTDVLNAESIVNVGSNIAFMTNKGVKTLTTTAVYGNFTTDEIARKINRSVCENVYNPMIFNIVRKRQLIIVPDTSSDNTRKKCYVYQYDIGAGMQMDFAVPIYDMQDTDNGVIIAGGKSLYRWSFEFEDDNGELIEQEIVSKKYATSNRLYTRMVDIGVSGDEGETVVMKWANKTVNYQIPEKRRMINVFSVCRESEFSLYTTANISLEYIKLYIFEQ